MATANWDSFEFMIFTPEANWNNVSGVYIFAGITPGNRWKAYYIGQASSFSDRLPNHERWDEARRAGATHVHALVVPLQANRDSIEAHLISAFQPPLNQQLK